MTFPRNEAETIALFKLTQARLGWHLVHLQTAFPDAVIENESGQQLIVEFEFESKNFRAHKHDPSGCDLVIAYKDSWENPPVPVWALKDHVSEEAEIIRRLLRGKIPISNLIEEQQRYDSLWNRCSKAEMKILEIKHKLNLEKLRRQHEGRMAAIEQSIPIPALETKTDWIVPVGYFILGYSFLMTLPYIIDLFRYLINGK